MGEVGGIGAEGWRVRAGTAASESDPNAEGEREAGVPVEGVGGDEEGGESSKDGRAGEGEKVEGSEGGETTAGGAGRPESGGKDAGVASRHDESPRGVAVAPSDFKAIAAASAADASVFTFGDDEEDYDSEEELH